VLQVKADELINVDLVAIKKQQLNEDVKIVNRLCKNDENKRYVY